MGLRILFWLSFELPERHREEHGCLETWFFSKASLLAWLDLCFFPHFSKVMLRIRRTPSYWRVGGVVYDDDDDDDNFCNLQKLQDLIRSSKKSWLWQERKFLGWGWCDVCEGCIIPRFSWGHLLNPFMFRWIQGVIFCGSIAALAVGVLKQAILRYLLTNQPINLTNFDACSLEKWQKEIWGSSNVLNFVAICVCLATMFLQIPLSTYTQSSSSTSEQIGCSDPFCVTASNELDGGSPSCTSDSDCPFEALYGDGSSANGSFVSDLLTYTEIGSSSGSGATRVSFGWVGHTPISQFH